MTLVAPPEERAIRLHLESGRFRAGVEAGRWRLLSLEWPVALVAVSASSRPNAPGEFVLRLDLTGYPQDAPTGGLWDVGRGASLPAQLRPKGHRLDRVFRADWENGLAMYAPWDRVALRGHAQWPQTYPRETWNPTRDLSFLLSAVHELLNADDYLGL